MPTNVNIQNSTSTLLTLSTGVTPSLSDSYWGIYNSTADADAKTQVLWMDRNVGITDGDTWVFTTAFEFEGTSIQLQESLTGTRTSGFTLNSTIANTLTIAGGVTANGNFTGGIGARIRGNVVISAEQTWLVGGQPGSHAADRGIAIGPVADHHRDARLGEGVADRLACDRRLLVDLARQAPIGGEIEE